MRQSLICLATLAISIAHPSESSAGVVVINTGKDISELGPVDASKVKDMALPPGVAVGYQYSRFGIFWLDIWRWEGEYCMFEETKYFPVSKSEAAMLMGVSESSLSEPFWYKVPPGSIVLGVIAVFVVIGIVSNQKKKQKVMALVGDPRYQEALDIFRQQVDENETAKAAAAEKGETVPLVQPDPWNAAISHLTASGVDKAEAEAEFGTVLAYALEQANKQANV